MAKYRVLIKPSAAKEIEAVDQKKDRQRIVSKILSLAEDPRPPGHEKLAGRGDQYRVSFRPLSDHLLHRRCGA